MAALRVIALEMNRDAAAENRFTSAGIPSEPEGRSVPIRRFLPGGVKWPVDQPFASTWNPNIFSCQ
jgi:hypothetical protein